MNHELEAALRHYHARRPDEAEAICRRALAVAPENADALHLLGVIALTSDRLEDAVDLLRRAIRARPAFAEAYNNLGVALERREQYVKAENAYHVAVQLQPAHLPAHCNLGNLLRKQGRVQEAADAFEAARRINPDDPKPYGGLGMTSLELGRSHEALDHYRRWSDLQPHDPAAHSDLLFWLLHDPTQTPATLLAEHRRWSERHERPLSHTIEPNENDRSPNRRLRVGYVSADFREHPTARFLEPVLAHHDHEQFEVHCYSDVKRPDEITARFRTYAHLWRDTASLSHEHLASAIRADRIDLLVDPTGHMGGNRLPVFARRPAPVQLSYLYPHSTGLSAMDYRVTDTRHDPPGLTDAYHTETLLRVEGGCAFAYRPRDDDPPVADLPALRNGFVTFGSLNRAAKLSPQAVSLWARVLRAVPRSRLMALATGGESNASVRDLFERNGMERDRLTLVPTAPRPQYLALAQRVDVLLDPFPYAGMTTTCDFLWQGVPTVTLVGALPQSRAGASLLGAVDLSYLVAESEDQYVRRATLLAADVLQLATLRRELRDRVAGSPLRDERGLTTKLELVFRKAWEWQHSTDPNRR